MAVSLISVALLSMTALAGADPTILSVVRDADPVLVRGVQLPEFAAESIDELALFRWDVALGRFVPIPFQIDERVDHVFSPGTPLQFVVNMYDVFGEEDGKLDADDELVFLFGDAGPTAPPDAPWLVGAESERYEIVVQDPRPGAPVAERRAYLFEGASLPRSPREDVQWNMQQSGALTSSTWAIEFSDRWVLSGYRVLPSCGSGEDLIDRFKGREGRYLENESEEDWNATSSYVGALLGPIRAVRYVRGAASGVNTMHHDVVYASFWERDFHVRVHPVPAIAVYFDLRPKSGTTLFSPEVTNGVAVDGIPDSVGTVFVPWSLVRGPAGGYVALYNVPASPYFGSKLFFYDDDVNHDDATAPGYPDEDHSAFGSQGIQLKNLTGSDFSMIEISLRIYPLCSNVGDSALGTGYRELVDNPLTVSTTQQSVLVGPVRTLHVNRAGADVNLAWEAIPGVTTYRVYAAPSPDLPRASWTLRGTVEVPAFQDVGAASLPESRSYSVVGVVDDDEGDW